NNAHSQRLSGHDGRASSMENRSSIAATSAAAYQVSPVTHRFVVNSLEGSPARSSDTATMWLNLSLPSPWLGWGAASEGEWIGCDGASATASSGMTSGSVPGAMPRGRMKV